MQTREISTAAVSASVLAEAALRSKRFGDKQRLTSVALLVVEELPRATGIDQEKNIVVFFLVILAFALICLD